MLEVISGIKFLEESIKTNCYRMEVCDDIYRRELIKSNNLLFKENLLHEDELFTPLVFSKAKKVKLIDIDFYYYRQRETSITKTRSQKNELSYLYIFSLLLLSIESDILKNIIYGIIC